MIRKVLMASGLIAVLLAFAWGVFVALKPSPARVEIGSVERGPLRVTIDAEGRTRVRDRFVVAAPVAGRLARISLRRGDLVARDAVVARIDPLPMAPLDPRQVAEARARVAAAEQLRNEADTVIEHARADCDLAQREFARMERLVETGDVSRQEFDRAHNAVQTCRQQMEAAMFRARAAAADVNVAKAALIAIERAGESGRTATVLVRAPVAGRVQHVAEESERVVTSGTPLLEMSGSGLELVIDLLSSDAVKVHPGTPVLVEGWGGEETLQARVRLIEPSAFTKVSALGVEEQRVNVIADLVSVTQYLGDGYRIEARVIIWQTEDALLVPSSAIYRRGDAWAVFVLDNGRAMERLVEIGHRTGSHAEVLAGLDKGTRVIVHPSNAIKDGAQVKLD